MLDLMKNGLQIVPFKEISMDDLTYTNFAFHVDFRH